MSSTWAAATRRRGHDRLQAGLSNTPTSATQQVIDINGARPGTADYETFITDGLVLQRLRSGYTSCNHDSVHNAYKAGVDYLLSAFGHDYWYGGQAGAAASSAGQPSKRVGMARMAPGSVRARNGSRNLASVSRPERSGRLVEPRRCAGRRSDPGGRRRPPRIAVGQDGALSIGGSSATAVGRRLDSLGGAGDGQPAVARTPMVDRGDRPKLGRTALAKWQTVRARAGSRTGTISNRTTDR
jgi:hypothetical protein